MCGPSPEHHLQNFIRVEWPHHAFYDPAEVQHGNPVAAFVMGLAPAVVVVRADQEQAKNERFFVGSCHCGRAQ